MSASLTIHFKRSTSTQPRDVLLVVKNYCTDALLPGATVQITGPNGYSFSGQASGTGEIALSQLVPGEYTVKTTLAGYVPSDEDALANDRFTV